jgi:hypothetical protein
MYVSHPFGKLLLAVRPCRICPGALASKLFCKHSLVCRLCAVCKCACFSVANIVIVYFLSSLVIVCQLLCHLLL